MKAKNKALIAEIVNNFDQNELYFMLSATIEHIQRENKKFKMADGGLDRAIPLKDLKQKVTKAMELIKDNENKSEKEN